MREGCLAYLELVKGVAQDAHFKAMQLWVTAGNPKNTKPELPAILRTPSVESAPATKPKRISPKVPPSRKRTKKDGA